MGIGSMRPSEQSGFALDGLAGGLLSSIKSFEEARPATRRAGARASRVEKDKDHLHKSYSFLGGRGTTVRSQGALLFPSR
jgi:hypothetical protein